MKKVIFATGNQGKMKEIREILGDLDIELLSLKDAGIDADDALGGEFLLVQLRGFQFGVQRTDKIAPDHRLGGDGGDFARRDLGKVHDVKVLLQKILAGFARRGIVIEDVEGVIILVLRIDAVACKAAAQTVAAVVHGGDGADDFAAADALARTGDDARNRTSRGNPDLTLSLHTLLVSSLPKDEKKEFTRPSAPQLGTDRSGEPLCSPNLWVKFYIEKGKVVKSKMHDEFVNPAFFEGEICM